MEYHNISGNEDLFKHFKQSIKQNNLETFNTIKQRLTNDQELTAFFISQLEFNSNNDDDPVTLLYYAIFYQNYIFTKTLLELKANPDEISGMVLQSTFAENQASAPTLYFLSKHEHIHPTSLEQEETPLVLAAFQKNRDLVYLLISHGVDPLIYDMTTRHQDLLLREAQTFVLNVRDQWISAPLENTINNLKTELNMVSTDSDNTSDQSYLSPSPFI